VAYIYNLLYSEFKIFPICHTLTLLLSRPVALFYVYENSIQSFAVLNKEKAGYRAPVIKQSKARPSRQQVKVILFVDFLPYCFS
jgi:hypothetical protein